MNTEFMLTIPVDYLIVFAVILACMVGALVACVVMLKLFQTRLEAIYEAVMLILDIVDRRYQEINQMSEKISDIRNDLNVCHDKLDIIIRSMPPSDEEDDAECHAHEFTIKIESEAFDELAEAVENEWPEPGEVVELEERDVDEAFKKVANRASETTMNMTEAAASLMDLDLNTYSEYDVDDLVDKKAEDTCKEGPGQAADDLPIHMISREEYLFGEIHEYGKFRLWYDAVKDILRCSTGLFNSEEFEPATATFLGDGLRFFGVSSQNKNVIYIRNHNLKADFMVEKASVITNNGVENR